MTLAEMKFKILRLIEETNEDTTYTDDPDISVKINDVINQVMFELARMKKIPAREVVEVDDTYIEENGLEYDLFDIEEFYQLDNARFESDGKEEELDINMNFIKIPGTGTLTIYYYKYPTRIDDDTTDDYTFELSDDALEILPYGAAADILKSDVSNSYGQIYQQRYETMLSRLDSRYNTGSIYIDASGMELI